MPPWAILVLLLEVPAAKSYESIRAQLSPRLAASSTTPAPFAPPPIINMSNSIFASFNLAKCSLLSFISKSYLTRLSRERPSSEVGSNSVERMDSIRLSRPASAAYAVGVRLEPVNVPYRGINERIL